MQFWPPKSRLRPFRFCVCSFQKSRYSGIQCRSISGSAKWHAHRTSCTAQISGYDRRQAPSKQTPSSKAPIDSYPFPTSSAEPLNRRPPTATQKSTCQTIISQLNITGQNSPINPSSKSPAKTLPAKNAHWTPRLGRCPTDAPRVQITKSAQKNPERQMALPDLFIHISFLRVTRLRNQ